MKLLFSLDSDIFCLFSAVVMCLPADETGKKVLEVIDSLHLAQDHNTLTIFIDVSNLPSWKYVLQRQKNITEFMDSSNVSYSTNYLDSVSSVSKKYILIYTLKNNASLESVVLTNIKNSLLSLSAVSDEESVFLLSGLHDDDTFRSLLTVKRDNSSEFVVAEFRDNLDEWVLKHKQLDECDACETEMTKALSVLGILGCSCMFVTIILGAAALARNQLLKKRITKGPYKVLLTATDFVFPQIADSRRVSGVIALLSDLISERFKRFPIKVSREYMLENIESLFFVIMVRQV